MVRAANGSLIYAEKEEEYHASRQEERERAADPYESAIQSMMAFSVSRIRECCDQIAEYEDVIDFLSFQTPDGSAPATFERRSNRQTLLEDACNAIDWFQSDLAKSGTNAMTFREACDYLGADHEIGRDIIMGNLRATCLTPTAAKKLSDFLGEIVGEGDK